MAGRIADPSSPRWPDAGVFAETGRSYKLEIAIVKCCNGSAQSRPTMGEVVNKLRELA